MCSYSEIVLCTCGLGVLASFNITEYNTEGPPGGHVCVCVCVCVHVGGGLLCWMMMMQQCQTPYHSQQLQSPLLHSYSTVCSQAQSQSQSQQPSHFITAAAAAGRAAGDDVIDDVTAVDDSEGCKEAVANERSALRSRDQQTSILRGRLLHGLISMSFIACDTLHR